MNLSRVVDAEYVGMLQPSAEADLAQETIGSYRVSQLRAQDLERDRTVVPDMVGEVDRSHAAATELALDAVAVGHSSL